VADLADEAKAYRDAEEKRLLTIMKAGGSSRSKLGAAGRR
jgi:hypothetical protein